MLDNWDRLLLVGISMPIWVPLARVVLGAFRAQLRDEPAAGRERPRGAGRLVRGPSSLARRRGADPEPDTRHFRDEGLVHEPRPEWARGRGGGAPLDGPAVSNRRRAPGHLRRGA